MSSFSFFFWMNDFVGNTPSFWCFLILNCHLTSVPCQEEWEHCFSTIFKILNCWFFNVVLIVCYFWMIVLVFKFGFLSIVAFKLWFFSHWCFGFESKWMNLVVLNLFFSFEVIMGALLFLILNLLFVLSQDEWIW